MKLVAADGTFGDTFGKSVSLFGIERSSAQLGTTTRESSGAAYVFVHDASGAWLQEARLTASDPGPEHGSARPSRSSGIARSWRARCRRCGLRGTGAAWRVRARRPGAWLETAKLSANDADAQDYFGNSVALFGDLALIGAFLDEDLGVSSGSAYLFERDEQGHWNQVAKLHANDGDGDDGFGVSVALFGERALVGASGDEDRGEASGSAYLFERDRNRVWVQVEKLLARDGAALDVFGASVSLSGERALVGAFGDDDSGDASGAAYVFERDSSHTWTEVAKLAASDGTAGALFGSVSISGGRAVIGARRAEAMGESSGAAYVYERHPMRGWIEVAALRASDGEAGDFLGSAVSSLGDRALVGASFEDHGGSGDQGAAYVFPLGVGETYRQSGRPRPRSGGPRRDG